MKFHQVTTNPQSKIVVLRLKLILTIKIGFCCDIALLFYVTALKL